MRRAGFRPRVRAERGELALRLVGGVRGERAVLYVGGSPVARGALEGPGDLQALIEGHQSEDAPDPEAEGVEGA